MQLYTLFAGKSKKRMWPIMTDELNKCENFRDQRIKSGCSEKWHEIKLAEKDASVWRKRSASVGGNKCDGKSGYVSKRGFQYHT